MNEQKTEQLWHAETARAERKARLSRMKDKNGGKKPIKMSSPTVRIVTIVVLVVAILIGGGWYALNSGLPQQQLAAMTINKDQIKVVELNYYYYMLANNFGIDLSDRAAAETLLAGPSNIDGYETLNDYIVETAAKYVQENYMLAAEAVKAGLSLSEDDQLTIDNFYSSLDSTAQQAGTSQVNYMTQYFGKGASVASLTPVLERILLAQKFTDQKSGEMTVNDADIKAYYDEHQDEFDVVSYRSFQFAAEIPEGATDEQKTQALADAKAKADAMKTLITDEESFKIQAIAHATADLKDSYTNDDASLSKDVRYSSVTSLALSTWLFDDVRKAGDISVVEDAAGSTVLYFIERSIDDTPRVDVRHILFLADEATATAEEIAAAKGKAETTLATYQAGEQTEAAFAELAKTSSEDNADDGGLYEGVYPGQMVESFDAWIFDETRKPGDTGIVQTNYGFHVMYFVKESGQEWSINIRDVLADEAYKAYLEETRLIYPFELQDLGLKFIP